ncbi:hypothetical protein RhiirC2_728014 [Rhizophagus irregularis]|uniref:Uncharacterized protein n=1 Tax=Rhizophagus irregularis TaxID=588596 RepID=A0A2N1NZG4_9GLOM|nr:hypothetical protein RhiirC2_728014 [Rhizophagus irregularis]
MGRYITHTLFSTHSETDYVEQNEKLQEAQAELNAKLAQRDLQNQIKIIIK